MNEGCPNNFAPFLSKFDRPKKIGIILLQQDRIWRYIEVNPARWVDDDENPNHVRS